MSDHDPNNYDMIDKVYIGLVIAALLLVVFVFI
jgi:hypothetical protein